MFFLNPAILWGLFALAIPIIIHLFHFRRFKKVYFTNTRFLDEVREQTKNRTRLRNLLVLLARLLAFTGIILAFAQPTIPTNENISTDDQAISIFIDNSFSMDARGQDVPLLDEAKAMASELLSALPETYDFQILTHDFEGRHQRVYNREEAQALIDEIEISSQVHTLNDVLQRQKQTLTQSQHGDRKAYIISDFQQSITNISNWQDSSIDVTLIPLAAVSSNNLAVDSCWFEEPVLLPGVASKLYVLVRNYGDESKEDIRLSLNFDNNTRPIGTVNIPAGGTAIDTVLISPKSSGWQRARVLLEDYPVQFDDEYFLTFNVANKLNILVIHEGSRVATYDAAYAGSDFTSVEQTNVRSLNYASFPRNNLIILHELNELSSGLRTELENYARAGGNVLIFPRENGNVDSYNALLQGMRANTYQDWTSEDMDVGYINVEEFVFSNVFERLRSNIDLPKLKGFYRLTNIASRQEEVLLRMRNGRTFIGKYQVGNGHLYLCASPLNPQYNNLVANGEIFVPMLHKMALAAVENYQPAYVIGETKGILTKNQTTNDPIFQIKGEEEFIPSTYRSGNQLLLSFEDQINRAGFYDLLNQDTLIASLAFNYNRIESDLSVYNEGSLSDLVGSGVSILRGAQRTDMATVITQQQQGRQLWRWCIIFALAFLLIEQLLLRFFKT